MKKYLYGSAALSLMTFHAMAELKILSDFNDGVPDWSEVQDFSFTREAFEEDGFLNIRTGFTSASGNNIANTHAQKNWINNFSVRDGDTTTLSVDLIDVSADDVNIGLSAVSLASFGAYNIYIGSDHIALEKRPLNPWPVQKVTFAYRELEFERRHLRISLSITGVGPSVLLNAKVSSLTDPGLALFSESFLDTRSRDASVPFPEAPYFPHQADPGAPYRAMEMTTLLMEQFTDGTKGDIWARFDNLTCETTGPLITSIVPAVQVTWPDYQKEFRLQSSPSPSGPWSFIDLPVSTADGFNQVIAPTVGGPVGMFFRLADPEAVGD